MDILYYLVTQKFSEKEIRNFIKKYPEKCDWEFWVDISCGQNLSEGFIREFQGKVDWDWISEYQKLSEDFIREFQNKVCWNYISRYQKLSEKFLIEFIDEIESYNLIDNEKIPEKIKNRIINLKKVRNS